MSIDLKSFKNGSFKHIRNERENHPVLVFLKKNKRAYTVKEIVKSVTMNKGTVRSILRSLEKDKKVIHNTPYFAYLDHIK